MSQYDFCELSATRSDELYIKSSHLNQEKIIRVIRVILLQHAVIDFNYTSVHRWLMKSIRDLYEFTTTCTRNYKNFAD